MDEAQACAHYGACTTGLRRRIKAGLRPSAAGQIVDIVKIASLHVVPLYPISTGRNWGYGSANPPVDDCVIVDLSGLDRILDFDAESGVVTLEPGVTQGMLRSYLDARGLPFMVPTTGGGPDCSLLGNALERGYGITPHADHFAAVMSLEAVLADGSLYRPLLAELGGAAVDTLFKWGIGPYLDGLFAQGNAGIVTRMSIALARRPEAICAFLFSASTDSELEQAVAAVREGLRQLSGVVGSINLMNTHRILAMSMPYPAEQAVAGLLPPDVIARHARRHRVGAWTGVGALYGSKPVVAAARRVIKRILNAAGMRRLQCFTPQSAARLKWLSARLLPGSNLARMAGTLDASLQIMAGNPSRVALPLAYWRSGKTNGVSIDPARDGCGLLWYAPLLPMRPERVRAYVNMVEAICREHQFEPLITLTSLSERCIDSSVPLLFERADPVRVAAAHACYDALFEAGQREGFLPYRLHVGAMDRLSALDMPCLDMQAKIRRALDPNGIIAPGRYGQHAAAVDELAS